MTDNKIGDQIIASYQRDENMMILIFAQWCVNHDRNPVEVYTSAYPGQGDNAALKQAVELTVPKEEAGPIDNETVLTVLSLFGNDDLAFAVSQIIEEEARQKRQGS
ncbi:hypothetical protein [Paenibacillus tarimensis]|uniref:hypothetical protein n=1 Tax=Paenibacillus tarimensis TaxID=416012 RepID=UPI001F17DEC8|nr:hypothetical protein [Paenibacillus tarimensis]MCF2944702.1 hypothetical protein [Paenibacillus tarimensis]